MQLKKKNRRAIINTLKYATQGIEELPKLPEPGQFPSPGFLLVELPIPEAMGFDKCCIFCDGILLTSRSGFNLDQLEKLNQGTLKSELIHHYSKGGEVLCHSNYMWLDMKTFMVDVFLSV